MNARRNVWLIGATGLLVLLASLGCGVCPLIPQPTATPVVEDEDEDEDEETPRPEETPTPERDLPTLRPRDGMEPYANPLMGFRLLYPEGWVFDEQQTGVLFAEDQAALDSLDPAISPVFVILAGSPQDVEDTFGAITSAEDLLDSVLDGWRGEEEYEEGDIEPWTFGGVPGVGVEIGWLDSWSDVHVRAYCVAAVDDEVAGVALGGAPEEEYGDYAGIFQEMFSTLELFPPEIPEPVDRGEILPGETVRGELLPRVEEIWTFDAEEGQYVTIRLSGVAGDLDTYLELYDADEELLDEDDDSGGNLNSAIVDFRIPDSGTFTILVKPYGGQGTYELSLEIGDEPSGGGEIRYGETVEDVLSMGGRHTWEFEGATGDVVTIAMNAVDGDLDCYLELYGPDDELLITDDDSGGDLNSLIEAYELPDNGTYRIIARAYGNDEGPYELSLELQ